MAEPERGTPGPSVLPAGPNPNACPVCEAPRAQGVLECANCGRLFEAAAEAAVAAARLPELEPTLLAEPGLAVSPEAVQGLEATSLDDGAPALAPEPFLELEATASAPVALVGGDATPAREPTAQAVQEPRTIPGELRCRYCGTVGQRQGLFCDRCGMRLPKLRDAEEAAAARPAAEAPASCRACGCRRFAEGRCVDCGHAFEAH
ncbi:MAG: hypothetical protein ACYCWW_09775 [Deltaproteobacteria bacterium]